MELEEFYKQVGGNFEDVKNMSGLHINSVAYENSTGNLDLTITYTVYMVEK